MEQNAGSRDEIVVEDLDSIQPLTLIHSKTEVSMVF